MFCIIGFCTGLLLDFVLLSLSRGCCVFGLVGGVVFGILVVFGLLVCLLSFVGLVCWICV